MCVWTYQNGRQNGRHSQAIQRFERQEVIQLHYHIVRNDASSPSVMRDTCPSEDSNCYPEITRPSFEYTLAKRGIMRLTVRYHISFHQRYTRATIDVRQRSSSKHERDQHEDYVTATLETRDESVCLSLCLSWTVIVIVDKGDSSLFLCVTKPREVKRRIHHDSLYSPR